MNLSNTGQQHLHTEIDSKLGQNYQHAGTLYRSPVVVMTDEQCYRRDIGLEHSLVSVASSQRAILIGRLGQVVNDNKTCQKCLKCTLMDVHAAMTRRLYDLCSMHL